MNGGTNVLRKKLGCGTRRRSGTPWSPRVLTAGAGSDRIRNYDPATDRRRTRSAVPKPGLRHGTRAAYNEGCGCEDCLAADRLYQRTRQRDPDRAARYLREPPEHGTANGYANYGCRCADCRAAYARYQQPRRRARGELPRAIYLEVMRATGGRTHGKISTYNRGCHCELCRSVAREKRAEYRRRKRDGE